MIDPLSDAKGEKLSYLERLRWFSSENDKMYCKRILRTDVSIYFMEVLIIKACAHCALSAMS